MIKSGIATVYVSDLDRAVRFYTDVLGLKLKFNAGGHFAQLDAGGFAIGLHPASAKGPTPGAKGSISVGFSCSQPLDQTVAELTKRGVSFRGPIVDDSPVRLAFFGDPDGNDLYLSEFKSG